ncbi:uncharacterized protein LOC106180306 [Lingula anatina]|uniref:Uncharacterized protein LOC106180306 n=1 Tax=Lingula anatina TaxID=7574 RepID=A0A1S3KB86_LINAN|nr:uncharacterized protein LOC106180306 [Lingula anatina]|eukprot:XP_013419752.1 uncharacterized protein LOC106180306 [Lingula anatina]
MALSVLEFKNFDFIPDGFHSFEETVTYCKKFTEEVRNILEKVQDAQDLFQTLVMILEYFTLAVDKLVICRDSHELVRFLFLECCKPLVSLKLRECEEKLQFSFKVTLIKVHDAVVTTLGFPYFWQLYGIAKVPWDDMVCKMMAEQDLDTKEVFTYIGSQDMNLMRLRADVMQKNDCEAYCMNLCTWLLKHPFYRNDTDLRARQLMLLHKLGEKDKFHVETWKVDCCMGLDIVKNHPMIREERKIFVSLVQTFLVQDWVRPKHKCCTKELLRLWLPLQWRDDVVKVVFEEGVMKLVELAVNTTQVMYLVEMLQEVFGKQFHSLCFKICSIRLQAEKLALEEAKDQKKIEKSEQATSSLSYVCQVVSALQDGCWMKKVSLLTSLSLAPTEETFHLLRKVSWLCDQECDQREGYEEHNEGCIELDSNNEDHVVSSPDVQISHGKQTQSSGGGSQLNMTLALNKGNPVLTNMGHGDPDTTATGQTLGTCSWSHLRNSPEDCLNILGNWERSKHGLDITKQSGAHHEDQDMDSSNKHAPEMDEENQGRQHSQIEAGVQDGVERMNKFQDKLLGNRGRIPGPLFQEVIDLLSSIRDQSLDPSLSWPDLQTSVLTYMQKAGLYYDSQSGEFLCNIQPVVRVERLKERSQSHEPNTASSEGDGDEEDADDDYRTRWPRVINGFVTPYVSDVVRQDRFVKTVAPPSVAR